MADEPVNGHLLAVLVFAKEKHDGQVCYRVVSRRTGVCARYHLSDHELGRPGIQKENPVGFTRYLRQRF